MTNQQMKEEWREDMLSDPQDQYHSIIESHVTVDYSIFRDHFYEEFAAAEKHLQILKDLHKTYGHPWNCTELL